jgi:hypothetical protein
MISAIVYLYIPIVIFMLVFYATGLKRTAMKETTRPLCSDFALLFKSNRRLLDDFKTADKSLFAQTDYPGEMYADRAYKETSARRRRLRAHFIPLILASICAGIKLCWGLEALGGTILVAFSIFALMGALSFLIGALGGFD